MADPIIAHISGVREGLFNGNSFGGYVYSERTICMIKCEIDRSLALRGRGGERIGYFLQQVLETARLLAIDANVSSFCQGRHLAQRYDPT